MQHLYTNTHSSRTHSISIKRHIIQMLISRPLHLLMRLVHWTWYWLTWKRPFLIIIFFPVFTGSSPPPPPALVSLIKQYSKYLPASYFNQHKQTFIKRRNLNKFFLFFSCSFLYLSLISIFVYNIKTDGRSADSGQTSQTFTPVERRTALSALSDLQTRHLGMRFYAKHFHILSN